MRVRNFVLQMLLLAVFSAFAQAQVVVTDDANTSSFTPKTNYGSSIALIVCSGSNTYIKFGFANLPSGINGGNISGANAVLYVDAVLTSGTMDLYAVNGSWSEGTITYNSAPALGKIAGSGRHEAMFTRHAISPIEVVACATSPPELVQSDSTNRAFAAGRGAVR